MAFPISILYVSDVLCAVSIVHGACSGQPSIYKVTLIAETFIASWELKHPCPMLVIILPHALIDATIVHDDPPKPRSFPLPPVTLIQVAVPFGQPAEPYTTAVLFSVQPLA